MLLKMSFVRLAGQSDQLMAHFFATLFVRNPEMRTMFPLAMDAQRRGVFQALAHFVRGCDHPEALAPWLSQLAIEHRRYGVTEEHYRPFFAMLLETMAAFSGSDWTPRVRAAWDSALRYMCVVMADAARGARDERAWWVAEVTGHEMRRPDLAVLTIRPDGPLPYLPGQHVSIQVPRWPRAWREYSVANAPSADGLLRLHVRAVPGGMVSTALVHQTRVGDTLIVGRARGEMTAEAVSSSRILCVAGGTGLAPIKAIVEELLRPGRARHPGIMLLLGARAEQDLYDLPDLRRMERANPAIHVTPVVSGTTGYGTPSGILPQMAARHFSHDTGDVIICGPPAMVTGTATVMAARAPGARIHFDPPGPHPALPRPRMPATAPGGAGQPDARG